MAVIDGRFCLVSEAVCDPTRIGDRFGLLFVTSMVACGVVGVILCPVGVCASYDLAHYVCSAIYMVDHWVLLVYLRVAPLYCWGFSIFTVLFFVSTGYLKVVKKGLKLGDRPDITTDERWAQIDK